MIFNLVIALVAIIVVLCAADSEVLSIITLCVLAIYGLIALAIAILNEIDRMEQERRNAEW